MIIEVAVELIVDFQLEIIVQYVKIVFLKKSTGCNKNSKAKNTHNLENYGNYIYTLSINKDIIIALFILA
jgi:hypothetical protein